ncbi:carbohydrate kinase family protein (plasmid) [Rhizobium sp. RCAM05350]|nr:carbohydrate kinase family protein [Rhizobium sp. RCAM05350]
MTDLDACERAASSVLERSSIEIIVVHSPAGAIALPRGEPILFHAPVAVPSSEIAGANGAGDAFAAGLIYALHEAWPLIEALQLAHATAAASLRNISTTESVESWKDCLALASQWGWRHPSPSPHRHQRA